MWPELSRQVGWRKRLVRWPRLEEVNEKTSDEQILVWQRFLPSPVNRYQNDILKAVLY